jgi:hypothetical protein
MRVKLTLKPSIPALALLAIGSVGLAACGDDDGDNQAQATPKKISVTATEAGKRTRLSVPKSAPAGLVTIELTNTARRFTKPSSSAWTRATRPRER